MVSYLMAAGIGMLCLGVGLLAGVLIMRNNVKYFRLREDEFKQMVLDGKYTAEQIVARVRNNLDI
jgi:hypothetical protein